MIIADVSIHGEFHSLSVTDVVLWGLFMGKGKKYYIKGKIKGCNCRKEKRASRGRRVLLPLGEDLLSGLHACTQTCLNTLLVGFTTCALHALTELLSHGRIPFSITFLNRHAAN